MGDTYESVVREYEGPFGDWHQERLCAPREFLKQGQQNYQDYQGMFADDSGSNGVSFICNNGTNLNAGPDLCHVQVTASSVVLKPRVRQHFLTTRRSREL